MCGWVASRPSKYQNEDDFFFCPGDITRTLEALAFPNFSKENLLVFWLGFMPAIYSSSAGVREIRGRKERVQLCLLVLEQRSRNLFNYHPMVIFLFTVIGFFIFYFYIFYFSGASGGKGGKDMGLVQLGNHTQIVRAGIQ